MGWLWREVKGRIEQEQLVDRMRITGAGVPGREKQIKQSIRDVLRLRSLKEHDQRGSLSQREKFDNGAYLGICIVGI